METFVHVGLTNALLVTILAGGVAGLAVTCRRRPAIVHGLWLLVLVKFLVPSFCPIQIPGWTVRPVIDHSESAIAFQAPSLPPDAPSTTEPESFISANDEISDLGEWPNLADSDLTSAESARPPEPARANIQFSWINVIGVFWLSGSLIWMSVAVLRIVRFRRLIRKARPADANLQVRVGWLAERLGLSICPSACLVDAPIPPLLWALTRIPRLLIPSHLWDRLSEEQQNTLLLHELAHLRRGDHWVRRIELLVFAIYWWHPVVWWTMRQLREAEEQCCDAWVVWTLPNSGHSYAAALVETLDFLSRSPKLLPLGASGIEALGTLKRRLSMIVREQTSRAMPRWVFWTVALSGVALLPLLPIPAQDNGGDEGQDASPQSLPSRNAPAQPREQPAGAIAPWRPDRSEQIEAAKDQVELMQAKVMIKRAEIEEMNLRIRQAERNLQRLEELYKKGVLEESALNKGRNEAELLPTQLPIKKAELAEVEVSLKQAMRRLSRLESNRGPAAGMGMPPPTMGVSGMRGMAGPGIGRPGAMGGGRGLPGMGGGSGSPERSSNAPSSGEMPGGGVEGPGTALSGAPPGAAVGSNSSSMSRGRGAGRASSGAAGPGGMAPGMGMGGAGGPPPGVTPGTGGPGVGSDSSGGGRMMSMMGGPGGMSASRFGRSGAADLFEEKSWDFGSVRRGERARHDFRLTNRLDQPVHLSAVRVSAAFLNAAGKDRWIQPNESISIPVEMDTRKFTGDKTALVYVQFDQPSAAEVRLQVQAQSQERYGPANASAEPAKIMELEQKVDRLMKQIDLLHDELKQRPGKQPGAGGSPPN
jgi:beta-lactamase regulating signal transducer with metallopeptidase domain